jgi:hypothetical protein
MTAPAGPALRDIHLPPEPSWWPPAPGWWFLALCVVLLLLWLGRRLLQRRRMQRARAVLQREFARACALEGAEQVAALSELLRRAAQRYAPAAATLHGEDWLAFLDADDAEQPFRSGAGRLLLDGPYRAQVDAAEATALAEVVRLRLDRFVTRTQTLPTPLHKEVRVRRVQDAVERPGLRGIRSAGSPSAAQGREPENGRTSRPHV